MIEDLRAEPSAADLTGWNARGGNQPGSESGSDALGARPRRAAPVRFGSVRRQSKANDRAHYPLFIPPCRRGGTALHDSATIYVCLLSLFSVRSVPETLAPRPYVIPLVPCDKFAPIRGLQAPYSSIDFGTLPRSSRLEI